MRCAAALSFRSCASSNSWPYRTRKNVTARPSTSQSAVVDPGRPFRLLLLIIALIPLHRARYYTRCLSKAAKYWEGKEKCWGTPPNPRQGDPCTPFDGE